MSDDWSRSPPLEVLLEIDKICDQFESQVSSATDGDLRRLSEKVDELYRNHLLAQLAAIDMESRWQTAALDGRTPDQSALAERYLALAHQETSSEMVQFLVLQEFQIRHQSGADMKLDVYLSRFADHAARIEAPLRLAIWRAFPAVIQIGTSPEVFALEKPLVLGRQRKLDPAPIQRKYSAERSDRVIIAPRKQATVSRDHVEIELLADGRTRCRRLTEKSSVEIGRERLPYDVDVEIEIPARIRLGPVDVYLRHEVEQESPSR